MGIVARFRPWPECFAWNKGKKVKAVVSYAGAHYRVKTAYGPARGHLCVDCGQRAEQWSYDGGSTDELIEIRKDARGHSGKVRPMRYSPSLEHYSPRCKECHCRYDLEGT